jgi:hypothetical protein
LHLQRLVASSLGRRREASPSSRSTGPRRPPCLCAPRRELRLSEEGGRPARARDPPARNRRPPAVVPLRASSRAPSAGGGGRPAAADPRLGHEKGYAAVREKGTVDPRAVELLHSCSCAAMPPRTPAPAPWSCPAAAGIQAPPRAAVLVEVRGSSAKIRHADRPCLSPPPRRWGARGGGGSGG